MDGQRWQVNFELCAKCDSGHLIQNSHTIHLSTNPIALAKKSQRSPLR